MLKRAERKSPKHHGKEGGKHQQIKEGGKNRVRGLMDGRRSPESLRHV